MTEREFLIWLAVAVVALPIAGWAFVRVMGWLGRHGYVVDPKTRKPGGLSHAAMELQKLYAPSVEHRVEAEDAHVERAENDGE